MPLLDLIERTTNEHASAEIMGQRLVLIREQADALEKRNAALEQQLADCKKRISTLESELAAKTALQEFVEHRGALFKRNPSGGFHKAVYCPLCRLPMGNAHPRVPFNCARCHIQTAFTVSELDSIIGEITSL